MLGLEGEEIHQSAAGWSPVYVEGNLGVMSIGFMLPDPDEAVIWRGPRKNGLIKQFLRWASAGASVYHNLSSRLPVPPGAALTAAAPVSCCVRPAVSCCVKPVVSGVCRAVSGLLCRAVSGLLCQAC